MHTEATLDHLLSVTDLALAALGKPAITTFSLDCDGNGCRVAAGRGRMNFSRRKPPPGRSIAFYRRFASPRHRHSFDTPRHRDAGASAFSVHSFIDLSGK